MAQGGFASAVRVGRRPGGPFGRELIGYLKDLLVSQGPTLELGAGTGLLTGQLHRAGVEVLAVESDAESVAQLRRSLPAVTVIRADTDSVPLGHQSVRSVVTDAEGPAVLLASEVDRVLNPAGFLVLLTRSEQCVAPDGFTRVDQRDFEGRWVHLFRPSESERTG